MPHRTARMPGRTSVCRRRLTPQIHVMKTCCTVAAKICFLGLFSIIQKLAVHPHKRLDQLMQPARSRHPVVHLGVDVDRIIAVPRRQLFAVPESLQVCRLTAGREQEISRYRPKSNTSDSSAVSSGSFSYCKIRSRRSAAPCRFQEVPVQPG